MPAGTMGRTAQPATARAPVSNVFDWSTLLQQEAGVTLGAGLLPSDLVIRHVLLAEASREQCLLAHSIVCLILCGKVQVDLMIAALEVRMKNRHELHPVGDILVYLQTAALHSHLHRIG